MLLMETFNRYRNLYTLKLILNAEICCMELRLIVGHWYQFKKKKY